MKNTGDQDLIFLEMFRAGRFMDLSRSEWVTHTPPELMQGHLGIGNDVLPKNHFEPPINADERR